MGGIRSHKIDEKEYNDYDDYGDYDQELDEDELAIKESKKQLKKDKKKQKQAQGVQETDIDAVIKMLAEALSTP